MTISTRALIMMLLLAVATAIAQNAGGDQATLTLATSSHPTHGSHLVDHEGRVLYLRTNDEAGSSRCYDECGETWTPLLANETPTVGEGVSEALVGTIERQDGAVQVTYNDWPLYYFTGDEAAGDANGHLHDDVGSLVSAEGAPVGQEADVAADEAGNDAASAATSVLDGVFTEAQATRGSEAYSESCSNCHGNDLRGTPGGPALVGGLFMLHWEDESVGALYDYARTMMPLGRPGSLSEKAYADIVAHILAGNGFPAGDTELDPAASEALHDVVIERGE